MTVPGGMTGGGAAPGMMMAGAGGTNATAPSLQWIEFADDHIIAFDGREAKLFADFDLDQQPKRLSLRIRNEPSSHARIDTNWRTGIYRC